MSSKREPENGETAADIFLTLDPETKAFLLTLVPSDSDLENEGFPPNLSLLIKSTYNELIAHGTTRQEGFFQEQNTSLRELGQALRGVFNIVSRKKQQALTEQKPEPAEVTLFPRDYQNPEGLRVKLQSLTTATEKFTFVAKVVEEAFFSVY